MVAHNTEWEWLLLQPRELQHLILKSTSALAVRMGTSQTEALPICAKHARSGRLTDSRLYRSPGQPSRAGREGHCETRIVDIKECRWKAMELVRKEMVKDRRQACVVYPYLEEKQYRAGDEWQLDTILKVNPQIKIYRGQTIRDFDIDGVLLTCQYFIGYGVEDGEDQSLEWGVNLQADQLCAWDDSGFCGSLPPALTSTHFGMAPNLYYAVALIKKKIKFNAAQTGERPPTAATLSSSLRTPSGDSEADVAAAETKRLQREVELANVAARAQKEQLRRKETRAPSALALTPPVVAGAGENSHKDPTISRKAQQRRNRKARERQAAKSREEEQQRKEDEEFRKVLKQVDKLRISDDTVVKQDLESLESVQDLDGALRSLEKKEKKEQIAETRAKNRPSRALELEQTILEQSQRGGKMRREVEALVLAYSGPGVAPADGRAFAERLVQALLHGQPGASTDDIDQAAAEAVYGGFVDAFVANEWTEARLRVGRHVVLRAAALE